MHGATMKSVFLIHSRVNCFNLGTPYVHELSLYCAVFINLEADFNISSCRFDSAGLNGFIPEI